jgi:hypothetical protein
MFDGWLGKVGQAIDEEKMRERRREFGLTRGVSCLVWYFEVDRANFLDTHALKTLTKSGS